MAEIEPSGGRRDFFLHGLRKLLVPIADMLEQRLPDLVPRIVLRPPGAQPEREFLEACYRCGNCVEVCPAHAIQPLNSDDVQMNRTPYIDPNEAACSVCDGLECMAVCPSGALRKVASASNIRMGLADLRYESCLRTMEQDCALCVEHCPIGETAIRIGRRGRIEVLEPGCIGCGECQHVCPTLPKSIVVVPR